MNFGNLGRIRLLLRLLLLLSSLNLVLIITLYLDSIFCWSYRVCQSVISLLISQSTLLVLVLVLRIQHDLLDWFNIVSVHCRGTSSMELTWGLIDLLFVSLCILLLGVSKLSIVLVLVGAVSSFEKIKVSLKLVSSGCCWLLLSCIILASSAYLFVDIHLLLSIVIWTLEHTLVEFVSETISSSCSIILTHVTIVWTKLRLRFLLLESISLLLSIESFNFLSNYLVVVRNYFLKLAVAHEWLDHISTSSLMGVLLSVAVINDLFDLISCTQVNVLLTSFGLLVSVATGLLLLSSTE